MGYYVSMEIQLKTKQKSAKIKATLSNCELINLHQAEISGKGAYHYLYYKTCDFRLSPENEAGLLLMLLDLEPVHKPNNGKQIPNLVLCDDLECLSWGYIISFGQVQLMKTTWDYDSQAKPLNRDVLLARLQPAELEAL